MDLASTPFARVRDRLPRLRPQGRSGDADPSHESVTAAGGFAWFTEGVSQTFALVAIGLLVLILVGSSAIAEPINSRFRRLPEGILPPEADVLRRRWRQFHLARTCLGVAALVCLIRRHECVTERRNPVMRSADGFDAQRGRVRSSAILRNS